MWELPDPRTFDSLIDLIEDAAKRYDGREQMALRTDEGLELRWSARGHQPPLEARRVAAARARHQARRSAADLEPVDPGTARGLLRGDARRRGDRAARPAHGTGRAPAHRPERRRAVAGHRHRPRRTGPGQQAASSTSTSGPSSGSPPSPRIRTRMPTRDEGGDDVDFPARLGSAGRQLAHDPRARRCSRSSTRAARRACPRA